MQVKICPNCSAENNPDSESCAKCNWNIAEVQASEKAAPSAPIGAGPMPARRGSGGPVAVIIIIIAAAAFAGWWFFLRGGGGPEATINRFVSAVKAGDFESMKSTMSKSTNSLFSMMPGGEEKLIESMKKGSSDMNIRPIKTTYEGENAIVEIEEVGGKSSGGDGPKEFVLIKEDGQWKIDLMATGIRQMKNMGMGGGMKRMPGRP